MVTCRPTNNYLASPDFMATILHFMAWIEFPILSFGGYCILFKTPVQMNSIKWLMLNLHFWTAVSDVVLNVLMIPYILLPAMAGWGLGALDAPGFLFYCCVTLHAAIAASVIAIYENRFYCLYGWSTRWSRIRRPALTAVYLSIPFIFLPPYFAIPNQEFAREEVLKMLPCLSLYTFNDRWLFVLSLDLRAPFWSIFTGAIVLGPTVVSFFLLTLHKILTKTAVSRSMRTHNLQKKFAIALSLQTLFLMTVIVVPVFTGLGTIIFSYHNQALNNLIFITLSLHGVVSTIVMILVHRPYRVFTFSKIGVSFAKKRSRVHMISVAN